MAQRSPWAHALRVRADRCVFACALVATISIHPAIGAAQAVLGQGWQTTAVGSPALSGTATYRACAQPVVACGNFLVTAGGHGVESTSDQFRFVYRPFTGDGVVIARVRSIENVSAWSTAGVMIRESLSPGSKH